jgi:hypothetical protein
MGICSDFEGSFMAHLGSCGAEVIAVLEAGRKPLSALARSNYSAFRGFCRGKSCLAACIDNFYAGRAQCRSPDRFRFAALPPIDPTLESAKRISQPSCQDNRELSRCYYVGGAAVAIFVTSSSCTV